MPLDKRRFSDAHGICPRRRSVGIDRYFSGILKSNLLLIARKLDYVFGHSVVITARRLGLFRDSRVPPIADLSYCTAVVVTFPLFEQFELCSRARS